MAKSVPKGYTHNWAYRGRWKETKIAPGKWKIRFRATKGRKVKGYVKGQPRKGFRIRWKINAIQDAIKTSKGTYQTDMRGYKTTVRAGYRKRRKY